jgi:hypothetical protein
MLTRKKTFETITKPLGKIVTDLQALADEQEAVAHSKRSEIMLLEQEVDGHDEEAYRCRNASQNIGKLFEQVQA